jgi:DNA-binding CsgD family transcriptional regulator
MSLHPHSIHFGAHEYTALAVLIFVQAAAAVFFVGDVIADIYYQGFTLHIMVEAAASAALVLGTICGWVAMRRTADRVRRHEEALSVARGALAEMIGVYFDRWHLTPAEREVAFFALKGLDIAAIAALRGAAPGTIRAQLARIYGKAGVSSRTELLSTFVDELFGGLTREGDQPDRRRNKPELGGTESMLTNAPI